MASVSRTDIAGSERRRHRKLAPGQESPFIEERRKQVMEHYRKIPVETENEICAIWQYNIGTSIEKLAKRFNTSSTTVVNILRRNNLTKQHKGMCMLLRKHDKPLKGSSSAVGTVSPDATAEPSISSVKTDTAINRDVHATMGLLRPIKLDSVPD